MKFYLATDVICTNYRDWWNYWRRHLRYVCWILNRISSRQNCSPSCFVRHSLLNISSNSVPRTRSLWNLIGGILRDQHDCRFVNALIRYQFFVRISINGFYHSQIQLSRTYYHYYRWAISSLLLNFRPQWGLCKFFFARAWICRWMCTCVYDTGSDSISWLVKAIEEGCSASVLGRRLVLF